MSLSKSEWLDIAKRLTNLWKSVYFKCDDYLIAANVRQRKMRIVLIIYVDNVIDGKNCFTGCTKDLGNMSDISRRFYCLRSKGPSAKEKAFLVKHYGKKLAKKDAEPYRFYYSMPEFRTPGAFITHLKKHNPNIELLDDDTYHDLITAKKSLTPPS